nr:MAG TPA: hypothetical protein [Caudoviricetes sp.]
MQFTHTTRRYRLSWLPLQVPPRSYRLLREQCSVTWRARQEPHGVGVSWCSAVVLGKEITAPYCIRQ